MVKFVNSTSMSAYYNAQPMVLKTLVNSLGYGSNFFTKIRTIEQLLFLASVSERGRGKESEMLKGRM